MFYTFLNGLATDKTLVQFLTPEFELLGERKLLYNILPKFGACHLQLINLTFFNAFLIPSEVFKFSRVCLKIGKVLGLFRLKVEINSKIFFFSLFSGHIKQK